MIYLDTTLSSKEDVYFIKYLKIFPQIMSDLFLFKGFKYDHNKSQDHFFRNDFEDIISSLIQGDNVVNYSDYFECLINSEKQYERLCTFIDGLSPDENRLRYDRLQLLHLTIISFLNKYGYDFQYTDSDKINGLLNSPRSSKLLRNYENLIIRGKLDKEKEMKKLLKIIRNYA